MRTEPSSPSPARRSGPPPASPSRGAKPKRLRTLSLALGGALALAVALPGTAHADPPTALPANADGMEQTFQPAYDYDRDGCYPTPAIGGDGAIAPGLKLGGFYNGACRDTPDLDNTNGYARYKCDNGWCAILYALYFEKDQQTLGPGAVGHRHDWEHVVVWVRDYRAEYVSISAHGGFKKYHRDEIRWDGTHPKVVYHRDGGLTHAFRAASAQDEPPENHHGGWQFPDLVGWNGFPSGLRDRLAGADFGKALFGLKDSAFADHLDKAKPSGVSFNAYA